MINKYIINLEHFNVSINEYKTIMLENDTEKLFKLSLNEETMPILEEDCFQKCDKANCIKLDQQKKTLEKCLQCNRKKNKCFSKSIIGGLCDDCSIEYESDKLNCYDIANYGCLNPNNLDTGVGVAPYYIEIPDTNVNSPFDKKCVFCWNILNEF